VVTPPINNMPTQPAVLPDPSKFDYRAVWVSQNGALNGAKTSHLLYAKAGDTITFQLTLKNTGKSWWYPSTSDGAHVVKIGTWRKQDRTSSFRAGSWLSDNRAVALSKIVPTGGSITFSWQMTVPSSTSAGTYREYFRPVAEYVKWFGPTGIFWDIIIQ
jgi:hypothetical protein